MSEVAEYTEAGQGPALRFRTPTGLPYEIYHEVEKRPARGTAIKTNTGRPWDHGISPRRIDHVNFITPNVAAEEADNGSMLRLTRSLLALRRQEAALSIGDYAPVASRGPLLAYERRAGGSRLLIALNLGGGPAPLPEPAHGAERLLSTLPGAADELRGNEGVVVRLA